MNSNDSRNVINLKINNRAQVKLTELEPIKFGGARTNFAYGPGVELATPLYFIMYKFIPQHN